MLILNYVNPNSIVSVYNAANDGEELNKEENGYGRLNVKIKLCNFSRIK